MKLCTDLECYPSQRRPSKRATPTSNYTAIPYRRGRNNKLTELVISLTDRAPYLFPDHRREVQHGNMRLMCEDVVQLRATGITTTSSS